MRELPQTGVIPQWTLGDRLRKAREHAGLSQAELARDIGIARSSIVNYEAGKYEPSRPVLLSWSLRTEVSVAWLRSGDNGPGPGIPREAPGFNTWRTKTPSLAGKRAA